MLRCAHGAERIQLSNLICTASFLVSYLSWRGDLKLHKRSRNLFRVRTSHCISGECALARVPFAHTKPNGILPVACGSQTDIFSCANAQWLYISLAVLLFRCALIAYKLSLSTNSTRYRAQSYHFRVPASLLSPVTMKSRMRAHKARRSGVQSGRKPRWWTVAQCLSLSVQQWRN